MSRLLAALVRWIERVLIAPVEARLLARITQEREVILNELGAALQEHQQIITGEITSARQEIRWLNDELVMRPATAEQMRDYAARLDRVDERLAHLAARMYGKSIADTVMASRGPREFTLEDRQ